MHNTSKIDLNLDTEVMAWTGGVSNHLIVSDDSDSDFNDEEWESDSSDEEVDELEGDELGESLRREIEHEIRLLQELEPTPYESQNHCKGVEKCREELWAGIKWTW
ncbi:hypothetical protein BU17DRAFT_72321 [Hysterangium stoloniferum]|nr:hypothetical protein BU17DRAFT_72321 [Hysterangium stoloniferum]